MHVRFFRGNQQKLRIGLRLERLEVRVELVEAQIREIGGMSVAVEVHDHRRVDAHGLQHRLERRRPLGAVRHRLHGVGEMPVRAQRLVSGECGESIAVRVAEHVRQRRFRCARRTRGRTRPCAARVRAAHSPTGSTASSRRAAAARRCRRGRARSDATDTRGSTRSRAGRNTGAAPETRRRCRRPSSPRAFCSGPAPARARRGSRCWCTVFNVPDVS